MARNFDDFPVPSRRGRRDIITWRTLGEKTPSLGGVASRWKRVVVGERARAPVAAPMGRRRAAWRDRVPFAWSRPHYYNSYVYTHLLNMYTCILTHDSRTLLWRRRGKKGGATKSYWSLGACILLVCVCVCCVQVGVCCCILYVYKCAVPSRAVPRHIWGQAYPSNNPYPSPWRTSRDWFSANTVYIYARRKRTDEVVGTYYEIFTLRACKIHQRTQYFIISYECYRVFGIYP